MSMHKILRKKIPLVDDGSLDRQQEGGGAKNLIFPELWDKKQY
jgi:hypothetical protein